MKERPILFSAPMVRAILAGRKTQTRRVVKPQPGPRVEPYATSDGRWNWVMRETGHGTQDPFRCPYGQPGDRLWVREAFQPLYPEGADEGHWANYKTGEGYEVSYVATDGRKEWMDPDGDITDRITSPIHMPRWASRITLEVTGVRVERLQEISDADTDAEVFGGDFPDKVLPGLGLHGGMSMQECFARLWDSINGAGAWAANPWVWVVEFRRVP